MVIWSVTKYFGEMQKPADASLQGRPYTSSDVLYFKYIQPPTYVRPIIHSCSKNCCSGVLGLRGIRNGRGENGFIYHKYGGRDNDYDFDLCILST